MKIKYCSFFLFLGLSYVVSVSAQDTELFSDSALEVSIDKEALRRGLLTEIMDGIEGVADVTQGVLSVVLAPIRELIKLDQEAIKENPYRDEVAEVRIGCPICDAELAFRERRFPIIKRAQEALIGMRLEDEDVLDITFSGSGGGVRAKTYSLGACVGADKIGLLDCITCMSGLSGSSWFLAPWISSGKSIQEFRERGIADACEGIDIDHIEDFAPMFDALWVKFAYGQSINAIDLFGGWLANNWLCGYADSQHMVYLSDQARIIADGTFPLPVYTAMLANRNMPNHRFEFTPFEVGSRWLGAYVPTWSFGRKFKRGDSKSFAPEQSLGFMMGIFGAAIAASLEEGYSRIVDKMEMPKFLKGVSGAEKIFNALKELVQKLVGETDLGELRVAWAKVPNYVRKMRGCDFNHKRNLKFADAGIESSNPIFATYRNGPDGNAPDIIFVLDSNATPGERQLNLLAEHAKRYGYKFPKIENIDEVLLNACTVFGDIDDVDTPLVVYMPRVIDKELLWVYEGDSKLGHFVEQLKDFNIEEAVHGGFAKTFQFKYTWHQAELIANLAEFNMRSLKGQIREILQKRIAAKRRTKQK